LKILLTGGPGSGKTTQLESLEEYITSQNLNWMIHPEVSRGLQELQNPFTKEKVYDPANDPNTFTQAILVQRIEDFKKALLNTVNIYDRGLIDSLAYCKAYNCTEIQDLIDLCKENQYDLVIFFPFWNEIYTQDEGRCENNSQAKHISEVIYETLTQLEANFVVVPQGTVESRQSFIIDQINQVVDSKMTLL
jgi:predicted ATPase